MADINDVKSLFNLKDQLAEAKSLFENLKGDLNARYLAWRDAKIERANMTEMSDHEAWLFDRSLGLGGSDIGAILSMSSYTSRFMLFQDKSYGIVEFTGNRFTKWGNKLEAVIGDNFASEFGIIIEQSPPASSGIMGGSHWLRYNIDFDIPCSISMGEVKTASGESKENWGTGITPDMIGLTLVDGQLIVTPNGLDINTIEQCEFPLMYFCQMQYYLMMKNKQYCFLTALIGGNDERHYLISASKPFQDLIYYRATHFMFHNIIELHQPLKTPFEQMQDFIAYDHSGEADVDDHEGLKNQLKELFKVNKLHSQLTKTKKEMEHEIKMIIGEKTEIVQDGETLANWNSQDRKSIDMEAFEDEFPELFERYLKITPLRVLRLKKKQFEEAE